MTTLPARAASTVIGDVGQRPVRALLIDLICVPPTVTAQQKGVVVRAGFARHYVKKRVVQARKLYEDLLTEHKIDEPFTGPIKVDLGFEWPFRAGETKKRIALWDKSIPHDTAHPDVENAAKLLVDVLASMRFIENDGQIAELRLRKWWGSQPGITIEIKEILPFASARCQSGAEVRG